MDQQITQWLEEVLASSSWLEYDDLHITKVDKSYSKNRQEWVQFGLKTLEKSSALLKKISTDSDFFCALGFSLKSTKNRRGHDFFDLPQLISKIDTSPPSVYVLKKHWNQWLETLQQSSEIDLKDLDSRFKCYLFEKEDRNDNSFYRSIFIIERDGAFP